MKWLCKIIGHKYPRKVITPASPMTDIKCVREGCPFYNLTEFVSVLDEQGHETGRYEERQVKDTIPNH